MTFNPFDTSDFTPRWNCGHWEPWLGYLTIAADALIFLAYFAIPAALAVVLLRRRDFPFPLILALFVAFILSCGLTHLVEVIIFYEPLYRLNAYIKAFTAVVSLATAFVLIRALPQVLTIPTVHRTNQQLIDALEREKHLSAELNKARNELETRSSHMTAKMRRITDALTATHVVACRWDPTTGRIDWEIGFGSAAHSVGLDHDRVFNTWTDVLTPESWAELARRSTDACRTGERVEFTGEVAGAPSLRLRLGARPDPEVADQPRQVTGMFRFVDADSDRAQPS